ncbi:hypothetical protein KA005_12715, partial [bacterium]|nr:hypothetical protein [bacterium]
MSARIGFFVFLSAVFLPVNLVFAAGLQNPGFESGLQNWSVDSQADSVLATGNEGAADSGTYADLGIVVNPYIGAQMLRLSGPKQVNENQNSGANTVTQQYVSTQDSLDFVFRLFSWEHRGDDTFRFDVRDGNGKSFPLSTPLTITFPRGPAQTCDATPCEFVIDVGKRGDFLDSGWTKVKVTGLPTDGSAITVEYSVIGDQNEAHATWAYFDNA